MRHPSIACLMALLCSLVVFATAVPAAQRSNYGLETSLLISDNVEFDQNEESDLVFQVSPYISASRRGPRAELQFSYQLNSRKFTERPENDHIGHDFEGTGSISIVDRRLYLDAGLSVKEGNRDDRLFSRLDSLSEREGQETFLFWFVRPELYLPISDWAGQVLSYRASGARSLDKSDSLSGVTHLFDWRLDNSRQYDEFTWEVNYSDRFNEGDENIASIREQSLIGAFRWWLREDFALLGRAGRERDRQDGKVFGDDDAFWSVGSSYLPIDSLLFSAFLGPEDKEFRVRFTPNSRLSAVLGYLDRDAGFNNRSQWFGRVSYRGKRSFFSSQYTELTSDAFGLNQVNSTLGEVSGLNGLGEGVLNDLGISQNLLNQSVTLSQIVEGQFVLRTWSNQWFWSRRRNSMSLGYSVEDIIPVTEGFRQRNQQLSYNFSRSHGLRQTSRWFASWSGSEIEGQENVNSDLHVLGYRYEHQWRRQLSWGLQYTFREFHRRGDSNIVENRLSAYLRFAFAGGNDNLEFSGSGRGGRGGIDARDRAKVRRPGASSDREADEVRAPIDDLSDFEPGRFSRSRRRSNAGNRGAGGLAR